MEFKSLKKKHNLRDNMTPMELILTTLGDAATKQIAQSRDAKGFLPNKQAARSGGEIAGQARMRLEKETGKPVVSSQNFLEAQPPSKELLTFPSSLEDNLRKSYRKGKTPGTITEPNSN